MTQRIDHHLQTLIISSLQSLPMPLPLFHQPQGLPDQQIQEHLENLAIAQRLLQIHQLQAYYAIGQTLQSQAYTRSPTCLTRRNEIATKRIHALYRQNEGALVQAQFYLNDIQKMTEATFQDTLQQIELLFPEQEQQDQDLEWSD